MRRDFLILSAAILLVSRLRSLNDHYVLRGCLVCVLLEMLCCESYVLKIIVDKFLKISPICNELVIHLW